MRILRDVIRGNTVQFSFECLDANGSPILASNVVLRLAYAQNGSTNSTNVAMTLNSESNTYFGSWNTSGREPGVVDWAVVAYNGNAVSLAANAGSFRIDTNMATP